MRIRAKYTPVMRKMSKACAFPTKCTYAQNPELCEKVRAHIEQTPNSSPKTCPPCALCFAPQDMHGDLEDVCDLVYYVVFIIIVSDSGRLIRPACASELRPRRLNRVRRTKILRAPLFEKNVTFFCVSDCRASVRPSWRNIMLHSDAER